MKWALILYNSSLFLPSLPQNRVTECLKGRKNVKCQSNPKYKQFCNPITAVNRQYVQLCHELDKNMMNTAFFMQLCSLVLPVLIIYSDIQSSGSLRIWLRCSSDFTVTGYHHSIKNFN